jgi:hypothetical protein
MDLTPTNLPLVVLAGGVTGLLGAVLGTGGGVTPAAEEPGFLGSS